MKRNLIALALILGISAQSAITTSKRTDFSGATLGTAYTTSSPQKAICGLPKGMTHVFLYNGTAAELAFQIYTGTSAAAPSANVRDIYLPAGTGVLKDNVGIGGCIYQRSNSGSSVSTGYSIIDPW